MEEYNNFKPEIPTGTQTEINRITHSDYHVNGHDNPSLLDFKTPVEMELMNQEMKIRSLKSGIKAMTKNIITHQKRLSKAETQKESLKQQSLIAARTANVAELVGLHTAAKTKMKTMINAIPPQMKPVIVKKLKLEHRM